MRTRSLATGAAACGITAGLSSVVLILMMLLTPEPGGPVVFGLVFLSALSALLMMILLALYMYRDARARGMNGALSALLLFLIGPAALVVYLLIRPRRLDHPGTGQPLRS